MSSRNEIRGSPAMGLAAGTIAFFAGFAAVALFGITAKTLAPLLKLSIVEVSWLVAIPTLTGSLLRIPFGALVERFGGRPVILAQLGIALVGMAGLIAVVSAVEGGSLTGSAAYALLMLFGAVAGTGISTFASGIAYVSYWFPQRRQGFALGFYAGMGNTAPGIFTAILPFAVASLGLIGAYEAWAAFLLAMTLVFAAIGHDAYYFQLLRRYGDPAEAEKRARELGQEIFPTGSAVRSLKIAAKVWRTWALVVMYFTSFGGFVALTSWLPTYWTNFQKVSLALAGVLSGVVYSLLTALMRVPGGWLSDRVGGERVALAAYAVLLAGSLIMALSGSIGPAIAGMVVMAAGMGIANAAVFKLVPRYVPEAVGGATGWVGGLGAAGGLLLPPVMGYFVALFGPIGYAWGFFVFTALALASIALSAILYRSRP
ncbi:MAG: MFS transporter [Thermoproteus sp.]